MDLEPKMLSLHRLLSERLFEIPQYQRAYSWGQKQRADLFADIEKTHATKAPWHFMATIVGRRRETRLIQTSEYHVLEVVDGQQRLTTLVLLLKAIERGLNESNSEEKAVRQELAALLVKSDELTTAVLQTNHDTSLHCSTYLRTGSHPESSTARRIADRRLLEAAEECEAFVAQWTSVGRSLVHLVSLLKNRLRFLLHEITDESVVYTVFEVLNSRGLEVSWLDRLKSALMGIAFESKSGNEERTIDELHQIWRDVYGCIGLRSGLSSEALRFAATLKATDQPSRPSGEEDSVEDLRRIAGVTAKGTVDVSNWVLQVTEAVNALHEDPRRNGATSVVQARLLAVAIRLRKDLPPTDREALLAAWERVTFRIYGMSGKDARTRVGDYVRLAWRCECERLTAASLLAEIRAIGASYPIDKAIEELRDANCYDDWQPQLRYFLFRYEEHLAKKRGQIFDNEQWNRIWEATAARSIEHVWPQSRGSFERSETGIFVHRLGNLTLLPPDLNSRLGAKDPVEKKGEYVKTGLAVALDVAERIPTWDRVAIVKREGELLTWALGEWGD